MINFCFDMNQLDLQSVRTLRERERKGGKKQERNLVERHWQRLVAADCGGDKKGKEKSGRGVMDRDRAEN